MFKANASFKKWIKNCLYVADKSSPIILLLNSCMTDDSAKLTRKLHQLVVENNGNIKAGRVQNSPGLL